jgi:cysteine-S-conjugate beta-lyase
MLKSKSSLKTTHLDHYFGDSQLLPMWLCDIDIPYNEHMEEEISLLTKQVSLSYSGVPNSYFEDLKMWLWSEHEFDISSCSLRITPGIIVSIALCIDAFAGNERNIGVFAPCYSGILDLITHKNRVPCFASIDMEQGGIRFEIPSLEKVLKSCNIFILCNPHNPTGIVWTREELETIANIADKNETLVVADEVLADYVFRGRYTPYFDACNSAQSNSVLLQSFSKTFNCGGLMTTNTLFSNDKLKNEFELAMDQSGLWLANPLSLEIIRSLIRYSKEWRMEVKKKVFECISKIHHFFEKDIPYISSYIPESGLSMWLEFQKPISDPELFLKKKCKIAALSGKRFGSGFHNYVRISIGGNMEIVNEFSKRINRHKRIAR